MRTALTESWRADGILKPIAEFMRDTNRMLNNLFLDGRRAQITAGERIVMWSRASTGTTAMPFDFLGVETLRDEWGEITGYTVTLETGEIEIHGETGDATTAYLTPASMEIEIAAEGTVYVWVETTWTGHEWGPTELGSGASKPNDGANTYRKLLWEFSEGKAIKQYHRGNVEFVGWRMVE